MMARVKHVQIRRYGESLSVAAFEYEPGEPCFGTCQWEPCEDKAAFETIFGVQLCKTHFSTFYSEEPLSLKPAARWV